MDLIIPLFFLRKKLKKIEKQTLAELHTERIRAVKMMHDKHKPTFPLNAEYADEYNQSLADGVKKVSRSIKEQRKYLVSIKKRRVQDDVTND